VPGDWPIAPGPWLALICAAGAYAAGVRALHRRGRPWNPWRTTAYAAGLLAIAVALVSPLASHDELFPVHIAQHMLLGMLGPLLLALSAPVTLALRTLPRPARRTLVAVLHSRAAAVLTHPATVTVLFVAGLVGLYFTPLYDQTLRHPLLHELVHIHFMAAGCLFAWTFIGTDPVPRRGTLNLRIGLLLLALGSHAALAKLIYAGYGSLTSVPPGQLHDGAQLMYYAGDAVDLLLLLAFFSQWYAAGGRRLERDRRRAAHANRLAGGAIAPAVILQGPFAAARP
jgi:putative membrane protein